MCEMCPVYRAVNSGLVFGDHFIYKSTFWATVSAYPHTEPATTTQPIPTYHAFGALYHAAHQHPPKHSHTPPCRLSNIYTFFCGFEAFLCPLGMFIHTVCICIYCISFLRRSCSSLLIAQCTVYPAPSERGSLYST